MCEIEITSDKQIENKSRIKKEDMQKSMLTVLLGASALLASAQCPGRCESESAASVCGKSDVCAVSVSSGRPAAPECYTSDPLAGLELTSEREKAVRDVLTERGEKRSELNRRYQADLLKLQEKYRRENEKMYRKYYRKIQKELTPAQYDEFLRRDAKWPVNVNTFDEKRRDNGVKGSLDVQPGPPPVLMTE